MLAEEKVEGIAKVSLAKMKDVERISLAEVAHELLSVLSRREGVISYNKKYN